MSRFILALFIFNLASKTAKAESYSAKVFITGLEKKIESNAFVYSKNITKWLENINDRHLKNSELGKLIRYNEIKRKFENIEESRGLKKIMMALLPIIFHIGAASTWVMLTTILAAKSVAIGLILLVFKIAVSSAKVASFFTAWKSKHHNQHHDNQPWFQHGYHRSLSNIGPDHRDNNHGRRINYSTSPSNHDVSHSYKPDWTPSEYKSIHNDYDYGESKKVEGVASSRIY